MNQMDLSSSGNWSVRLNGSFKHPLSTPVILEACRVSEYISFLASHSFRCASFMPFDPARLDPR